MEEHKTDRKVFYSNTAGIAMTDFDGVMTFDLSVPVRDDAGNISGVEKVDQINVVMSLEHLKMFSRILSNQIALFEAQKFQIPDSAKEAVTTEVQQ